MQNQTAVEVWKETVVLPTYLPGPPDRNPMFLEKRVYQGSSGKVYPIPFTDRIGEQKTNHAWQAVWMENQYLRIMILPEIGGRIHVAQDKTNGYDFIYRQNVIKPALVGLAGPWISGGIEFNWPQHHRPATFLPVAVHIEEHPDGAKTVWLGDHDPRTRLKGMHGVCLHPGKAFLELKVRVHNRTPFTHTFLWWANAAVRVHEAYQSFFPTDVDCVADHAKRATSRFPLCQDHYYGIDYGTRGKKGVPAHEVPPRFTPSHCRQAPQNPSPEIAPSQAPSYAPNDLSWYANIPVPTSYMALGSGEDFFGGYDHARQAGLVHIANHHIAPGKKQWTWGNHEFGYAWDRNLTDADGPYVELMAGVYTDNQPDFSFLQPGETRSWSQYWYPIQKIGPAHQANLSAAVHLEIQRATLRVGVSVTAEFPGAVIRLERGRAARQWLADLRPGQPFLIETKQAWKKWPATGVTLRVLDSDGREIIAYSPLDRRPGKVPPPATEPPPPAAISSADALYLTGLHLEQYRHATRDPEPYWREALRRDPLDARCHNALGLRHLRRGEFTHAEHHFRAALQRATRWNPNPSDGEPYYNLGLCLRFQLDALPGSARQRGPSPGQSCPGTDPGLSLYESAYAAFYKATWNHAWAAPAYQALAELDCRCHQWPAALEHLNQALRLSTENLRARDLKAIVLRQLHREKEAEVLLQQTVDFDPLDWWARSLLGQPLECDTRIRLDLALDAAQAGLFADAIALLEGLPSANPPRLTQDWGTAPLVHYYLGWLHEKAGQTELAQEHRRRAANESPDYCFPVRVEEIAILEAAIRMHPRDARALSYLGNLFYDQGRHRDAVAVWEKSVRHDPSGSVVWRNLGLAYFNAARNPRKARRAYDQAFRAQPDDARLLYERDQLWKRLGESPQTRLRELEEHASLVRTRDDLSIELCALYNQTGQHERALEQISARRFQPWEGGEGQVLGQHVRTRLALGRTALARGDIRGARDHFHAALLSPPNLGEAKHLLANQSDIHYYLGEAYAALGQVKTAQAHWRTAATFRGDFQEMRVRTYSETTYFSALAWGRLGQAARQRKRLRELLAYARKLRKAPAAVDYFATSLPALLLFDEDLPFRQETTALFLQAQAWLGLGKKSKAKRLLATVLRRDPNHPLAADFLEQWP